MANRQIHHFTVNIGLSVGLITCGRRVVGQTTDIARVRSGLLCEIRGGEDVPVVLVEVGVGKDDDVRCLHEHHCVSMHFTAKMSSREKVPAE